MSFIGYSYWETGHRGLQSGERLHADLLRLQLAHLENNKRELELTTHVSLRSLDPMALLRLRTEGSCEIAVPEWLFDLESPGHYLRRIRTVALSLPAVTGPYTSVAATLTLQRSSIRRSPGAIDGKYTRTGDGDPRFLEYPGSLESVVTSTAVRDAGMFEPAARDDRHLPFELAGAIGLWTLSLPRGLRTFDYSTISDALLHISYTARPGVRADLVEADLRARFAAVGTQVLARSFSLRHDFASQWAAFRAGGELSVRIEKDWFPYFTQTSPITVQAIELQGIDGQQLVAGPSPAHGDALGPLNAALAADGGFDLAVPADDHVVRRDGGVDPHLVVRYTLGRPPP
jgi:hypothetical protein